MLLSEQDLDAKIKARQEVVAGPLKDKFAKLAQMVRSCLTQLTVTGSHCVAGTHMHLTSGWWDGIGWSHCV